MSVPVKPTDIQDPEYFHKVVDCQYACPAHTPVPEYIRLIAAGKYTEAYLINTYIHQIRENIDNNFKDFDLMLVQEEQEIQQLEVAEADIRTRLSNLRKTLEALPILQ